MGFLIHSADPLSLPIMVTIFTLVVRPFVRPHVSKSARTKQIESNVRYWRDCGSGQVDHGWHLIFFFFACSGARNKRTYIIVKAKKLWRPQSELPGFQVVTGQKNAIKKIATIYLVFSSFMLYLCLNILHQKTLKSNFKNLLNVLLLEKRRKFLAPDAFQKRQIFWLLARQKDT